MQIVIDISERIYDTIQDDEMISREQLVVLQMHILKGTLLPKGHGRLIDADALLKEKRRFEDFDGDTFNIIHEETVINADTIIEADNAESEDE